MAFTLSQLNLLDAAIATGSLIVEYGDKREQYRSLDDMLKTRNLMAAELGMTNNKKGRRNPVFTKGL